MQGKCLEAPGGSRLPALSKELGRTQGGLGCAVGGTAGGRCPPSPPRGVCLPPVPQRPALLQMGCSGSARWARRRTDPTSRSPPRCSSACRMSCGTSWHKVKGQGVRPRCAAARWGAGAFGVLLARGWGGVSRDAADPGGNGAERRVSWIPGQPPGVSRPPPRSGLSWQDGVTQYVISQEMERIPRLRPPPSLEPAARDR